MYLFIRSWCQVDAAAESYSTSTKGMQKTHPQSAAKHATGRVRMLAGPKVHGKRHRQDVLPTGPECKRRKSEGLQLTRRKTMLHKAALTAVSGPPQR
jgi:hypothetical protein